MHCNQRLTHSKPSRPGKALKESKALQNSSGRCPLNSSFQALLLSTASLDAGTMKFACRAGPSRIRAFPARRGSSQQDGQSQQHSLSIGKHCLWNTHALGTNAVKPKPHETKDSCLVTLKQHSLLQITVVGSDLCKRWRHAVPSMPAHLNVH